MNHRLQYPHLAMWTNCFSLKYLKAFFQIELTFNGFSRLKPKIPDMCSRKSPMLEKQMCILCLATPVALHFTPVSERVSGQGFFPFVFFCDFCVFSFHFYFCDLCVFSSKGSIRLESEATAWGESLHLDLRPVSHLNYFWFLVQWYWLQYWHLLVTLLAPTKNLHLDLRPVMTPTAANCV